MAKNLHACPGTVSILNVLALENPVPAQSEDCSGESFSHNGMLRAPFKAAEIDVVKETKPHSGTGC